LTSEIRRQEKHLYIRCLTSHLNSSGIPRVRSGTPLAVANSEGAVTSGSPSRYPLSPEKQFSPRIQAHAVPRCRYASLSSSLELEIPTKRLSPEGR
jgi:hypothetical protein